MTPRSAPPVRPPGWAVRLLRAVLAPGLSRDALLGDLEEELTERASRGSAASARRRYGRQAVGIALRYLRFRVTDHPSPTSGERTMLRSMAHDLGQAIRSLVHAPSFSLLTVATLAVGIGATTAIFSVVYGVMLRSLPYPDADALVVVRHARDGSEMDNQSEPELHDYEREVRSFSAVAGWTTTSPTLGSTDEPERIPAVRATAALLPLLGVQPRLGRFFTPEEDVPGAPATVVLSHALWVRSFGADPGVVGRSILLEGVPTTVVGVMPEGFVFPDPEVMAWMPLGLDTVNPWARNNHYLGVLARLAPGVGLDGARTELEALAARSTRAYPEFYPTPVSFHAYGLRDRMVGDVRAPLLLLLGAVLIVLLIASANAAAIFLARGEERRGEIAVRTALGAGQARVVGQLLGESLMVALAAAAVGSALAIGGVAALRGLAPASLPRLEAIRVDVRVLGFGLATALATGLLFGLAPALQALGSDVREVLAAGARGAIGSRRAGRFRRALVVAQLALATMLALGAGLLVRSFRSLRAVEMGFDPRGVLTVPLSPSRTTVPIDTQAVAFYQALEGRIAALPGVTAVGSAYRLPLVGGLDGYSIQVEGRIAATVGDAPVAGMQWATPGYFGALGIALLRGRIFTEADRADAPLVAVVNERLAQELWPGESALGKRLRMFPDGSPWMEVVGVVADVKHHGLRAESPAKLYIPHLQGYRSGYYSPNRMIVVVRTDGDPASLASAVRGVVRAVGPDVPIGSVRPMDEVVSAALASERFTLLLLGVFTAIALLLSAVGVYGVVARAVAARTREIGLRMAVGADRGSIARSVLREGALLAAVGCAVGLVAGVALSGLMRSLLFGVSPLDAWSYVLTAPLLALTAAVGCVVPALRAARLDPVRALRDE